jgi:hypothetical protein
MNLVFRSRRHDTDSGTDSDMDSDMDSPASQSDDLNYTDVIHFKSAEMVTRFCTLASKSVAFRLHAVTDTEEWDPKLGSKSIMSPLVKGPQDTAPPLVMYFEYGRQESCMPGHRRVAVYIATTEGPLLRANKKDFLLVRTHILLLRCR